MTQDNSPSEVVDSSRNESRVRTETPASPAREINSPTTLILQWLTYAFWGWFLLAVAYNVALLALTLLDPSIDVSGAAPYSLASLFVLLPIAAVTDILYQRHEPTHKTGSATALMAIHAVLFALLGIGSLIVGIFMLISLVTSSNSDHTEQYTAIITAAVMAILYAATLARTVNPPAVKKLSRIFTYTMIVLGLVLSIAVIAGPLVQNLRSKDDRRITDSLQTIGSSVDQYVATNHKLPGTLSAIETKGTVKEVIDEGLVTIKPGERKVNDSLFGTDRQVTNELRYSLCANYTTEIGSSYDDSYDYGYSEGDPGINDPTYKVDSLYGSSHAKGEVCYQQRATYRSNSPNPTGSKLDIRNENQPL